MHDAVHPERIVRFGTFELNLEGEDLRRNGLKLKLTGQPFQVLAILLEHPGRIVTREELRSRLWADTFVDFDHNLNAAINKIREVLGDSAESPRFVETVPRRGYRFICPVEGREDLSAKRNGVEASEAAPLAQAAPDVKAPRALLPRTGWMMIAAGLLLLLISALIITNVTGVRDRLAGTFGISLPATEPRIESIAVLPFENLSGDPLQEYFADGMTEELITELGAFGSFRVISRTSVMRLKRTSRPLPEIAHELGVDGIVEGTVARSGNHVHITANFLLAATDRHLWANSYDIDVEDVLVVQGKVARSVADAIRSELTRQQQVPSAIPRRVKPEAYQAYLQGRYHANKWTHDGWDKAEESLRRSIELDPTFAPAYSAVAHLYSVLAIFGIRPATEVFPLAKAAALKAVELDDGLAEAHGSLGMVKLVYDWDWAGAEQEHERAVLLNPSSAEAHGWYSQFLVSMGRHEEALREGREMVRLDPASPFPNLLLAWQFYFARRHDEAISQITRVLELDPQFAWAYMELGWNYAEKRKYAEAITNCQRALDLMPHDQVILGHCGNVYGQAGRLQGASALLAQLRTVAEEDHVDPWYFAWLFDGTGDTDRSIEYLQRAYNERSAELYLLKVAPFSERLRSDRRFQVLLMKLHFPS